MQTICRNIQNNDLYKHIEGNKFKNLRTGVVGEISDGLAEKVLKINVESTILINENPEIENLINKLNLKIEK